MRKPRLIEELSVRVLISLFFVIRIFICFSNTERHFVGRVSFMFPSTSTNSYIPSQLVNIYIYLASIKGKHNNHNKNNRKLNHVDKTSVVFSIFSSSKKDTYSFEKRFCQKLQVLISAWPFNLILILVIHAQNSKSPGVTEGFLQNPAVSQLTHTPVPALRPDSSVICLQIQIACCSFQFLIFSLGRYL